MKEMLAQNGHTVVDVMVGKSARREIPRFFVDKIGMPVTLFTSPNFLPSKENRRVHLLRSVAYNTLLVPSHMKSIALIRKHFKQSGADIVINFYEILCGLAFSLFSLGVPEVCVAHQYLFLHPSFKMPGKYPVPEYFLQLFTRLTCKGATCELALSIRDYADDDSHHIKVVPPLLRQEVKAEVRHHGDYVLGYILNAGFYKDVMRWHQQHPHVKLHFFWDEKTDKDETKVDDNLVFHKLDDEKFLRLMAGCKAYATTAGFESVCEALYMGKPCLMVPAHVEQVCNATDAEKEMVGLASDIFDMDRLMSFAHEYEEDVEFRMWENHADSRIMAAIENAYAEYYDAREDHMCEPHGSLAVPVAWA